MRTLYPSFLKKFSEDLVCEKCGSNEIDVIFRESDGDIVIEEPDGFKGKRIFYELSGFPLPHLRKTCMQCKFSWMEKTKDSK